METVRSFIAIPIDKRIQQTLKAIQDDLRKTGADVKWVDPQAIHLTLKFLGEVSLPQIETVKRILADGLNQVHAFDCEVAGLGAFPNMNNPRIIWTGFKKGGEEMKSLAFLLETQLQSAGFPPEEREFHPHITLGRLRSDHNQFALIKLLKNYPAPLDFNQHVDKIILFKSTLNSSGPIYETLQEFPLK